MALDVCRKHIFLDKCLMRLVVFFSTLLPKSVTVQLKSNIYSILHSLGEKKVEDELCPMFFFLFWNKKSEIFPVFFPIGLESNPIRTGNLTQELMNPVWGGQYYMRNNENRDSQVKWLIHLIYKDTSLYSIKWMEREVIKHLIISQLE